MATFTAGVLGIDFDKLDLTALTGGTLTSSTETSAAIRFGGDVVQLFGQGFVFADAPYPVGGILQRVVPVFEGVQLYQLEGLSIPVEDLVGWVQAGDNGAAMAAIFLDADIILGSAVGDRLRGFAGADTLSAGSGDDFADGGAGADQIFGGTGSDTLVDSSGANFLRGEDGDDLLLGGFEFDDLHGNIGADTVMGGFGDDWVVGGKDDDRLFGDEGDDLVYGNLGEDTCEGGAGADIIRGGQQSDSLSGGAGADFVSGDRGEDTVSGGAGADIFHSSSDAGTDRILDFSIAQGDRVMLDPGTTYTLAQVGGDTVIMLSAGQVVLVGVAMSSLLSSSVFLG